MERRERRRLWTLPPNPQKSRAMSSQLDFYLARAAEARADAEAATLANVRDRCLRAAAAWDAMAARAHRGDTMRARQEADKRALAEAAAAPAAAE
jgi:DNA-binding transcriptional regulator YdaS (Cro superfamily)